MHKPLIENYLYNYKTEKRKIAIAVNINYVEGTISLIEKNQNFKGNGKKFFFTNGSIENVDGWLEVLKAMQGALLDAKARLAAEQEEKAEVTDFIDKNGHRTNEYGELIHDDKCRQCKK